MLTRVNFRQPSHTSSISSSSSLSSASFSSDSALSSTSGSSSSCCPCYSGDRMAFQPPCHSLQANSILSCNSYNSHTLECLYASLAISGSNNTSNSNSKNVKICRHNNCKCGHQMNKSTVKQPANTCSYLMILNSPSDQNCHCANCNNNFINSHPQVTWSNGRGMLQVINSTNNNNNDNNNKNNSSNNLVTNGGHEYSSPVKGEEVNRSRINSSGISKKCELCTTSSPASLTSPASPFSPAPSQVTFNGRESNFLNSNLKKASASPGIPVGEKFKSDTCQMTQLINENKQLRSIKESQALELKAQRLTLQEQRSHIAILEQALMITKSSVEQLKAKLASIQK